MTTNIPNPPIPNPAVFLINAGDQVVLYDIVSQTFIGEHARPVSAASSAIVFTVGFNGSDTPGTSNGIVTYGGEFSASPYSTNISLQSSAGYLTAGGGLGFGSPSTVVNNQEYLWTVTAVYPTEEGGAVTAALVNQEPAACGGACNLFTLTSVTDPENKNPVSYVPSQLSIRGTSYPAFFQLGTGGDMFVGGVVAQLQFFIVSPSTVCGSNADCTSSSAPFCLNNKCYPSSSLSADQIAGICAYSTGSPNNNIVGTACQSWCNSQPLNTPLRSNCDNAMINYCPAANPQGVHAPPITPSPCTCILAQAAGTPNPECFYEACVQNPSTGPQNYYTTSMQTVLNNKDCLSSCDDQFSCIGAGTCTVSNSLFCQTCGNSSQAITDYCGGSSPPSGGTSFFNNILTWIKDNVAITVGASVGVLVLLILLFVIIRQMSSKKKTK